ncbi:U3 small nucleolar RNA-associated protein 17 [Erysiphe neolycopersici]|uniref:U3 small nucleolar RNA-associated protein 17 n=1 Tax=Erysiphe neolycopersici TaxID=212602 RepID=A0A420HD27_9PEZI|nr:U3 small nucleolar RNA-associated protein 17 [Erysiphe neolycopersici]
MSKKLKRKRELPDDLEKSKRRKPIKLLDLKPTDGDRVSDVVSTGELTKVHGISRKNKSNSTSVQLSSSSNEDALGFKEYESLNGTEIDKSKATESWYLSPPIGGRMIRSDPVFTADEKFLIVATRATIQVITVANSLLIRSINLKLDQSTAASSQIVTTCLSPSRKNIIWVACSNGSVFCVDWTTGDMADSFWTVSSTGCSHMTVASIESNGRRRDVIFTTGNRKDEGYRTTANELADISGPISTASRTIYTSKEPIQILRVSTDGSVIVGASAKRILIGRIRSTDFDTVDKIKYQFRTLETKDFITSLDLRLSQRPDIQQSPKKKTLKAPIVDVVVGNNRGIIFVHNDIAGKLFSQSQNEIISSSIGWMPSKLHWHRHAVHSVKWSLDGNYIISGGEETVLVLWQLETGKRQFLPHMSSIIDNIVVSPRGSAYAIQLSDNSIMVLSTADLLPKTYISGIQAPIIQSSNLMKSRILKARGKSWLKPLIQRVPATVNPVITSQVLLAVGSLGEVEAKKSLVMSNPFLQTFDLTVCKSISTQALTRTNITNVNAAPTAHCLIEPRVTHLKISFDGLWLATVDQWTPPDNDYDFLQYSGQDLSTEIDHWREICLKFWQFNTSTKLWELVSRIDKPHLHSDGSGESGKILDLVAKPGLQQFTTIGSDRTVKTWSPKSRERNGVLVRGSMNNILKNWICVNTVKLGRVSLVNLGGKSSPKNPITGCISFSDDASVLAAAFGGENEFLHCIDTDSGVIRASYPGLIEDEIFGMEFLGQDLVILSNKLLSFDVVSEEVRHAFKLRSTTEFLSIDQKQEMIHLAIDTQSKTFAVALPKLSNGPEQLDGAISELVVFHQEKYQPVFKSLFPSIITALLPTNGSEGYLIIDATAEIYTALRKGRQAITSLALATSALETDVISPAAVSNESAKPSLFQQLEVDENDDDDNDNERITVNQEQEENGEIKEFPVVTSHQLEEIFHVGPAFALPPIEELFYQVVSLFSNEKTIPSNKNKIISIENT